MATSSIVVFKGGAIRVAESGESLALVDVRSDVLHVRDLDEGKCLARIYASKGRAKLDLSPAKQRGLEVFSDLQHGRYYPEAIEALRALGEALLSEQESSQEDSCSAEEEVFNETSSYDPAFAGSPAFTQGWRARDH